MHDVRLAQAADSDWQTLVRACARQLGPEQSDGNVGAGRFGLLYATDYLAGELGPIATALWEHTRIRDWAGTVGIGICATGHEYFDRPALVAMTAATAPDAVHLVDTEAGAAGGAPPASDRHAVLAASGLAIVHGDPRNPETPELLSRLARESGCFLVGGLSASRSNFGQVAGRLTEGGITGLRFGPEVAARTGLSQGCSPIGPVREVTDCEDNIIRALDGRPAQAALESDIGLAVGDLGFVGAVQEVHVAVPVAGSDTGDYMVRNLVGIDPEVGWIAIGDSLAAGERLMFVRRNAATAEADLKRMLDSLKRRAGAPPKAAVYHSCVARGPNLFGGEGRELALIGEAFGDTPLVGFFGNGEISHDRLYGYTGVLTLFL